MTSVYLSKKTYDRLLRYGAELLARGDDKGDLIVKLNPDLMVGKLLEEAASSGGVFHEY